MGTLYYDSKARSTKRWRVQIRHKGFKSISINFPTKEKAQNFMEKAEKSIDSEVEKRSIRAALNKLKENH